MFTWAFKLKGSKTRPTEGVLVGLLCYCVCDYNGMRMLTIGFCYLNLFTQPRTQFHSPCLQ